MMLWIILHSRRKCPPSMAVRWVSLVSVRLLEPQCWIQDDGYRKKTGEHTIFFVTLINMKTYTKTIHSSSILREKHGITIPWAFLACTGCGNKSLEANMAKKNLGQHEAKATMTSISVAIEIGKQE